MGNALKKIVILDDDDSITQLLEEILSNLELEIKTFSQGQDALEHLAKAPVDLILSDILMPRMDGFEFLDHLKRDRSHFGIPVIMLTAKSELKDFEKAISLGAVDYILKPFDKATVVKKVKQHLQTSNEGEIHFPPKSRLSRANLEFSVELRGFSDQGLHFISNFAVPVGGELNLGGELAEQLELTHLKVIIRSCQPQDDRFEIFAQISMEDARRLRVLRSRLIADASDRGKK